MGRATLLPRLGFRQEALQSLFCARGFHTFVAPLYFGPVLRQGSLEAPPHGLGLVLDPTTHLRQLPREERAKSFRRLPFGDAAPPYDPDERVPSDEEIETTALEPPELQRAGGATLSLTTYHVCGAVGTLGRDLDLAYARLAVADFRDQRLDRPVGDDRPFIREIYATIAAPVKLLRSPEAALALAEAYLEVGADGYWVKLLGFDENAPLEDIRAVGRFFSYLREGERPLVSCGPGQLHLALLAGEISASVGIAGHERFRYPKVWTGTKNGTKGQGRSRPVYSGRLLRSIMSHDPQLAAVFERDLCRCGFHPAGVAPTGREIELHTARLRAEQAIDALDGTVEERREWLLAVAARAAGAARDIGLAPKPIEPPFEALLEGLDGTQPGLREVV